MNRSAKIKLSIASTLLLAFVVVYIWLLVYPPMLHAQTSKKFPDDFTEDAAPTTDDFFGVQDTGTGKFKKVKGSNVPKGLAPASASVQGVVTTGTQTFAGVKTFNDSVGVGTVPTAKLHVLAGPVTGSLTNIDSLNLGLFKTSFAGEKQSINFLTTLINGTTVQSYAKITAGRTEFYDTGTGYISFLLTGIAETVPVEKMKITHTGSVGFNQTAPVAHLDQIVPLASTVGHSIKLAVTPTANALEVNSSAGSGGDLFKISSAGAVTAAGAIVTASTVTAAGESNFNIAGQASSIKLNQWGRIHVPAPSQFVFRDHADDPTTNPACLQLSGTTSSFPMLKRSATTVKFRLADDSADAPITVANIDTGNGAVELAAGNYTPTLTNVTNVAASTAYACQYMRVGNVVTVSGKVDIDPTLTAATELGISLPIASNVSAEEKVAGTSASSAVASQSGGITGDATNDRAALKLVTIDLTNQPSFFEFTYTIE